MRDIFQSLFLHSGHLNIRLHCILVMQIFSFRHYTHHAQVRHERNGLYGQITLADVELLRNITSQNTTCCACCL